ncbi:hypothetical protein [Mucilaginibacter celer]|uniref:Uncharacterized protein n=1 Tax=Mucilaginibacter celer TaxID=2305508 RepID=A0A494VRP2_9SPHI|nr:hypothetical protein [Mucilaginibacter celer]AYL94028.1 hypothetical protein HYN43_001395 [Mucilaginibacter celer]
MIGYIVKEAMQQQLTDATVSLLAMARELTWNKISDNCLYIISEEEENNLNAKESRKIRKSLNDKKKPEQLSALMPKLNELFPNLHNITLYIYRAEPNKTVIEISYYPKSLLHPLNFEELKDVPSMLHCQVAIPNYADAIVLGKEQKFNINWPLAPIDHRLKEFWHRLKYKYHKLLEGNI